MTIQKTPQKDSVLIGQLELYNRLWKEQDDIWQKAARKSGLPRTSYWILYTIVVTASSPLSQADLCEKQEHACIGEAERRKAADLLGNGCTAADNGRNMERNGNTRQRPLDRRNEQADQ